MEYELKGKVAVVTGAANGVGAGVVRLLLQEGAKHVAILDIDEKVGVAFEGELNAEYGSGASRFHRCDVTDDEQLTAALRAAAGHGGLDLVVNNAGIMNDAPGVYKKEIAINVTALITSTLKALELMRKDDGGKGGTVINISSVADGGLLREDRSESVAVCFGATATALITPQKLGSLDKHSDGLAIADTAKDYHIQRIESAAQGVIDAYKKGISGGTWVASRDRPAVDVTSNVSRAYEVMGEHN